MLHYAFANNKMLLKSNLFISIPIAGWQETFRSPASRLAGDFSASDSRLAGDQKVSCQPAGRRPRQSFTVIKKKKNLNSILSWFFYNADNWTDANMQ